jgi:hypothetical protein
MKYLFAAMAGLILVAASIPGHAADFRAYRANKQLQIDRIPTLNEDEPGCHNLLLGFSVYRVAQIGFEYCAIYEEKDCKSGTEVPVSWKQEEAPVKQFTQGDRWFLVSEDPQGRSVGSWYCEARE